MPTRLLLVRHGQTAWNLTGRFQGHMDIPLDDTGLHQAQVAARRLRHERPQAIYTSDLLRARRTAEAIWECITQDMDGAPPPPLIDEPRLREMNFGDWQGSTYSELKSADPLAMAAWEADMTNTSPPGGERLPDFAARAWNAYQDITATHPDGTAIIVAHGGPLQVIIARALSLPPERFWQFNLSNTGIAELNIYPIGAILNRFNDTAHLQGPDE